MNDDVFAAPRRRLTLRKGKERMIGKRHPWIFTGAIDQELGPEDAPIGDLLAADGSLLASGFYSRSSQIRLRALTFGEPLDAKLFVKRLEEAFRRREPLLDDTTDAVRLVHAEGDDISSIVIDCYGDVIVVEITNKGAEACRPLIVETLESVFAPRLIFFKNDLPARAIENLPRKDDLIGEGPAATVIQESGLKFHVDPASGQKTGFFLDQRENRRLTRELAGGRSTLNLFSYTGAFGVYAAAGGASSVINVDISAPAIEMARRNHALNGLAAQFEVADVFQYVRQNREQYDLLICDPPAFARSRGEVDRAARGYKDVNLHAMKMVRPGGLMMTFSCSGHIDLNLYQQIIFAAALDAGRRVSFVRRLTPGIDHPVSIYCPEGEYLKGFLLEVR
jgi:23S rRNA (cytosine1962-C5)-methyltransferase